MTLELYRAGGSPIHRLGAGWKLAALIAAGTVLFVADTLTSALAVLAGTLALYRAAGFTWQDVIGQLRPVWWVFALIIVVQVVLGNGPAGLLLTVRFAALLLLAGLVTMTTRSSDIIAVITRAASVLRPIGVSPGKVGLTFSLALRFLPVLAQATAEVREAQKARGLELSLLATAVPVTIRTLKMADEIAQAIDARGFDG